MQRINWNLILSLIIAVLAGVVLWRVFDVGTKWEISRAVSDLKSRSKADDARERLFATNYRGAVLDALSEALEESGGTPDEKIEIISTLLQYKAPAPVERALASENVTTRYAAGYVLYRRRADEDACKKIALEWLNDRSVGSRALAVTMAKDLGLKEAVPMMLEIIDSPKNDVAETRAALYALSVLKPPGVADRLLKLISNDAGQSTDVVGVALGAVNRLNLSDTERESLRKTLVAMLKDKGAGTILRMRAAQELARDSYNTPDTVEAVEGVLLSDEQPQVQRVCLKRAAQFGGHERIKELLHDRRVYKHPYTFIRHDVSIALQGMQMRDKLTFDILCDYLVDDSADDTNHILRQDAWLSLWLLTGIVHGIQENDLFRKAPRYSERPAAINDLFRLAHRAGVVSIPMRKAIAAHVGDLKEMKATRQVLQAKWPEVQARWEKQRADAEEKRKKLEEKRKALLEKKKKAEDAAGGTGDDGKPEDKDAGKDTDKDANKPDNKPDDKDDG